MKNSKRRPLLVVGVDGATFRIIKPLAAGGRLPNIKRLMDAGVHGVLRSTVPAVSPVAWTSFMTGANPIRHRIFDFSGRVPGSYDFRVNTAKNRACAPLWMNMGKEGLRVLVAGVTMTWPPDQVNGYMVSGLGAPMDSDLASCVWPPEFKDKILDALGGYRTVPEADMRKMTRSDREKERYLTGVFDQIDSRVRLFKRIWSGERLDFSMVFFLDTDGASHYFWKYMDRAHRGFEESAYADAIHRVYEKVDEAVGELTAATGGRADIILVSDHGFGPLNRVVFLNNWLAEKGYLRFKDASWLQETFSKVGSLAAGRRPRRRREIDWKNTRAFFNGTVGNIFVNLKGRDPEGTVDAGDYEGLCGEIKAGLENLADPETGERIAERVYTKAELSGGLEAPQAPDLVLTLRSGYDVVGTDIALHDLKDKGEVITDSNNWSGTHESEGVFIACGKNFKKGHAIEGANIIDMAPTILYALGVSVPRVMDGRPLVDAFDEGFLESNPVRYSEEGYGEAAASDHGEVEESDIMDKLRNLGYIE